MDSIGEMIKKYRQEHGMSMDEFASRCGLSKAYISLIERGKNTRSDKPIVPSIDTVKAIADVLGVDLNVLLRSMGYDAPMKTVITIEPGHGGNGYYSEPDAAALADELLHNEDLRVLFSASRDLTEEQMRDAYKYIKYLKAQNNDDN